MEEGKIRETRVCLISEGGGEAWFYQALSQKGEGPLPVLLQYVHKPQQTSEELKSQRR